MKKILLLIFGVFIGIFASIVEVDASGSVSVDKFNATIDIQNDGSMIIHETWKVNYRGEYKVAFRDIGYQKYNKDNPLYQEKSNVAYFDVSTGSYGVSVYGKDDISLASFKYRVGYSFKSEKDELGNRIECPGGSILCESIFIHVFDGMEKEMTFKYTYKIIGAVTVYNDIAELNWNLLEYFEDGINSAQVKVRVNGVAKDDLRAWGHGTTGGNIAINDGEIIFDTDRLSRNELLEFRILMPKGYFSNISDENKVARDMEQDILAYEQKLADQYNFRLKLMKIIHYGTYLLILVMLFVTIYVYRKYDKERKAQFDAKYLRELPRDYTPVEMSYLYHFKKINDEDLTATLLDLVRMSYLILDQNNSGVNDKKPKFKFILNKFADLSNLLSHEAHLINWFIKEIGDGESVTLDQIENYPKDSYGKATNFSNQSKRFVQLAKKAGKKHNFFDFETPGAKSKLYFYAVISYLYFFISLVTAWLLKINNGFAIITSLLISIIYTIYVSSIKRRSFYGNEDYAKWKAFKNFLLEFGNMKDYPIPGIVVWEHYLVYATSLKIADKVMEQLKVRLPKVSDEELSHSTYLGYGYRYRGFYFGYHIGRINQTMRTAKQNQMTTIANHHAKSVGGGGRGGGGFGGGRSFGGGGGGFRSR